MKFDLSNYKNETNFVYIDSWDEFAAAVEQLCIGEPKKHCYIKNIENLCRKQLTTKHKSSITVAIFYNKAKL